jgi:cephalosporin hydroxylase
MFPFWELVVAPILDVIDTRRVVEIGALRGENTVLMLERLNAETELHVIDPVPDFDPDEHARMFPGRYIFHRDLSLNVLPELPPMDAALIDGDHNWYTVYNECKALAEVARKADAPLPVMILHDVLWPYGRRDLYYSPDNIPKEFRQTNETRGMSPHKKKLLQGGGMNMQLHNAVEEGGPRNGVMTGLEDWMDEYDGKLRLVVLPIYFGLAIVVDEERLERQPALAELLDQLESSSGRKDLLELSERIRLEAAIFTQNVMRIREEQLVTSATRYLNLLKGALLDEHYLENELRIQHMVECIEQGSMPSPIELRDPKRLMRRKAELLAEARHAGRVRDDSGELVSYFPFTSMGRTRLDQLESCLDRIRTGKVGGDLVECGTGRGGGAIFLRGYLDAYSYEMPNRHVYVADRFRAAPEEPTETTSPVPGGGPGFPDLKPDLNTVRDGFHRFDLLDDRVHFLLGDFGETLPSAPVHSIAVLRIGPELGPTVGDVLDLLYDRITIGGFVVIDDYCDGGVAAAVDAFRARRGIPEPLERVDWSAATWCKTEQAPIPAAAKPDVQRTGAVAAGAPLAPRVAGSTCDLSVVIVFYNMKREAARTLHSLSRAYQRDIDDVDYEVVVVENGSDPDQRLGAEYVESFGPEFRYIDLGDEAKSSPVFALNHGIAKSVGRSVALMIDGAHVLTPRVLHFGMAGLRLYEPAIVTTQQWYVGPGQQPDVMADGYDQSSEDALFEKVNWPANGYRLFEIGHFIGGRDWFDGIWESNCVFLPRAVLEQSGGLDESFSVAGGGYSNLEVYERLGSTPGVTETTILGEGSFHQVHGGTTTNVSDVDERRERIASYAQHFVDLRGRGFRGPNKRTHYVGTMFPEAVRSKSRRKTAAEFFRRLDPNDPDGRPTSPEPIPEDLEVGYLEAYWRNLGWKKTSWLGRRVAGSPGDIVMYQEIISEVRPDWIIDLRTGDGGRAMFLASICTLLEHGRVLSIDDREQQGLPEHPRVTYLTAPTSGDETARRVREIVGDGARALVVLGTVGSKRRTVNEFTTYQELVPVGSYVIVEDTIVGGHPVWPSFGPGPFEAAQEIVQTFPDFVVDPARERYGLSFNPQGYLKRVVRPER